MTAQLPARTRYLEEVREQLDPNPDESQLITYQEAVKRYGEALTAIGIKNPYLLIRNLGLRGVIRRWDRANKYWVYPPDVEVYIRVAGQPRRVE